MFKIASTPLLSSDIEHFHNTKAKLDAAKAEHEAAKEQLLRNPMLASARKIEMERVNEEGKTLTGIVEVYEGDRKILTVSNVGWKISFSQPLAMDFYATHPGAKAFLKETLKLDARNFLKAAQLDAEIVDGIGVSYDEATPSIKLG